MTDEIVTKVSRRALVGVNPDLEVTQARRRALVAVNPDLEATQVRRRALVSLHVDLAVTKIVRKALVTTFPCTTELARAWTIRRVDGQVHRFTSLDKDLVFGGETYLSCGSMNPSASEATNQSGEFANMTLTGIVSDDGITIVDLMAGRLDGASFEEWEVPYDGSPVTPKLIQRGTWGRVEFDEEKGFSVEVTGDGAKLMQAPLTQPYTPSCRWKDNISDARCPVSSHLADFTVTGTVDEGFGARSFLDAARTEDADYFAFGKVTFTSGDNAGITAEIRGNTDGVFTLWPRLANPIQAGDDYTMIAGCDQLKQTCIDKFDAFDGFGGFPDVPGEDVLQKTPTAH